MPDRERPYNSMSPDYILGDEGPDYLLKERSADGAPVTIVVYDYFGYTDRPNPPPKKGDRKVLALRDGTMCTGEVVEVSEKPDTITFKILAD